MVNSGSEESLDSDTDFFGSLSALKDKFITEAEELFASNDRTDSRASSRSARFSAGSFDFSFPWSTKESDNERPPLEGTSDDTIDDGSGCTARDFVYNNKQPDEDNSGFRFGGKLKKQTSIRAANGSKVENGTLLQYSALTLTMSKIKPGDIPTIPDIIDDLHKLRGADPEQVQKIVNKLDAIQLTISSLDKRLEKIDRGLDNLLSGGSSRPSKEEIHFSI